MKKFLLTCIIAVFSTACTSGLLSKKEASDYFTEGFISKHCFQVLVNAAPAKNVSGVIDSRESAYYKAREETLSQAEKALVSYLLKKSCLVSGNKPDTPGKTEIDKEYLRQEAKKLLRYGKITEEYYQRNKSVVLVFRITRRNLKNKMDSINCRKLKTNVTGE